MVITRKKIFSEGPFSQRMVCSFTFSPPYERLPAGDFTKRVIASISRLKIESAISKYHLSSTLCTVKSPICVTAFSVITSLYGFGEGFAGVGVARFDVLSVFLLFGLEGTCWEKQNAVRARPMVRQ